jgi:hypothetical protein
MNTNKEPKFTERLLSELIPFENNPRVLTVDTRKQLKDSLLNFDLVEPLVINIDNIVIGGNQRLSVLKEIYIEKPDTKIPCILVENLTISKEKALNIALNRIEGYWDIDKLKTILISIDKDDLLLTGFSDREIVIFTTEIENAELEDAEMANTTNKFDILVQCKDKEELDMVLVAMKDKSIKVTTKNL